MVFRSIFAKLKSIKEQLNQPQDEFSKLMIQIILFKIAIVMRFAQMPLKMRKSQCFPSLMTFPFSPTSRSQQAKRGRGGRGVDPFGVIRNG